MPLVKLISLFVLLVFQNSVLSQLGCTDPLATNFDPVALENDGSCEYQETTIAAEELVNPMPIDLFEQSGMIKFDEKLWIHLDGGNSEEIFLWDIDNFEIEQSLVLQNVVNTDWEDIAQDETHIYIGDFGNNFGDRTDLKIYKIEKADLLDSDPEDIQPEIINFSYPEQTDFSVQNMAHDFDCEAMIVRDNDIWLFTKQWVGNETDVYKLPKIPGTYNAELMGSLPVQGLIAGADHDTIHDIVVLVGYELLPNVQSFSFMLWDFEQDDLLSGNKRKFSIDWTFSQMESIAYDGAAEWYVGNEYFEIGPVAFPNELRKIDLTQYLTGVIGVDELNEVESLDIFPNPTNGQFSVSDNIQSFEVYSAIGELLITKDVANTDQLYLANGFYFVRLISGDTEQIRKLIVQ